MTYSRWSLMPLAALALSAASLAQADVSVTRGATNIPDGEAINAQDLTVANDKLAFALAIESSPPWGVPRGTLVDLAAVKEGEVDLDRIAFADFIPDNWSAWPNDGKKIEVVEKSPERAVIRVSRNFGEAMVTTTYTLEAGSDRVHLETVLDNRGDAPLQNIRSGFTLWPDTGYLFGVPGLGDAKETEASAALTDRVVAYDQDWAFALHAPYFDRINYQGKDMYLEHSLKAGESRRFEGWLQVVPAGDLAPVVANEIERKNLESGDIHGQLRNGSGQAPHNGLVVIEKHGVPYAWTLADEGAFSMPLPVGEYQAYATAEGFANSESVELNVTADSERTLTFSDMQGPGTLSLDIRSEEGD
ncbi:MAG: phosphoesterase, partial [Chromohalobacter sp.]|nr:phosphoesterase [Chromohalobacter sp.]